MPVSVHTFSRVRHPLPLWHRVVAARVHAHRASRRPPGLLRRLDLALLRVDVWIEDHPAEALTVALVAAPVSGAALVLVTEALVRWVR